MHFSFKSVDWRALKCFAKTEIMDFKGHLGDEQYSCFTKIKKGKGKARKVWVASLSEYAAEPEIRTPAIFPHQ